ncbi:hypothetical protein M426DRAFT_316635 [Hypoxylon sp. CI-4A]|nr:hypothetical protein M426DRAFT_316635 [Hypoxylon sp. CI-4A]
MAIGWVVAAALAAFARPYIVEALIIISKILRRRRRRYMRFQWRDIPQGDVHHCEIHPMLSSSCSPLNKDHQRGKECWKSGASLASCFNTAWEISAKRPRYTESVPKALPLGPQYVCTDAATVLAFALCTASCNGKLTDGLSFGDTKVECETLYDGTTVAHISGSFQCEKRKPFTKLELERMLRGYPPWYREKLTTRAHVQLPFPIYRERDISRAGWIIAIGLVEKGSSSYQKPLEIYRALNGREPVREQHGRMFRQAVVRCRDHIRKNIGPCFPESQDVADALDALDYLISEGSPDGMPLGRLGFGSIGRYGTLPGLLESQFICDSFNEYRELDSIAKARLEPILHPTMYAAVHGARDVFRYLATHPNELVIPPELWPLDREVWLRDCVTELPTK